MEEEISLRELIDVLWRGKWLIAAITGVVIVLAALYTFVLSSPTYKSSGTVMIHQPTYETGIASDYVNQTVSADLFIRSAQTHEVLSNVITSLDLTDEMSVTGLRESFTFTKEEETDSEEISSIVDISIESSNADQVNQLVNELFTQTELYMEKRLERRLDELEVQYESLVEKETNELDMALKEYEVLRAGEGLPSLILLQDLAGSAQFIIDENQQLLEELKTLDKNKQIEYEQVTAKIERLYQTQDKYLTYLTDVQNTKNLEIIPSSVRIISEPYSSGNPVSPNNMLNLAIGAVLGLMLGVFVTFFVNYMKETSPKSTK